MVDFERMAHVCYEAARVIQSTGGEVDAPPGFADAPQWQKQSAYEVVSYALASRTPEALHQLWCKGKRREGWVYGVVRNPQRKIDPYLVPYSELPSDQQLTYAVYRAVVRAFSQHTTTEHEREMIDRPEDTCPSCGAHGSQRCDTRGGRDHLTRRRLRARLRERDEFNRRYAVGTPVRFWPGLREGEGRLSRTRSPAWLMTSAAVVSVEGCPGGIALTHIEVLD